MSWWAFWCVAFRIFIDIHAMNRANVRKTEAFSKYLRKIPIGNTNIHTSSGKFTCICLMDKNRLDPLLDSVYRYTIHHLIGIILMETASREWLIGLQIARTWNSCEKHNWTEIILINYLHYNLFELTGKICFLNIPTLNVVLLPK